MSGFGRSNSHSRSQAGATLNVAVSSSSSQNDLINSICPHMSDVSYSLLYITGAPGNILELPDCVATSTTIDTIQMTLINLRSFAFLPASLVTFGTSQATVAPLMSTPTSSPSSTPQTATPSASSLNVTGFHANGTIAWDQVWSLLPSLASLSLGISNMSGTLPDMLPSGLTNLNLAYTALSGTIPSTFLGNFSKNSIALAIDISNTSVTGTIPSNLFDVVGAVESLQNGFFWTANGLSLNSPLPDNLLRPLEGVFAQSFYFSMTASGLTGTIPNGFLPDNILATSNSPNLGLQLGNNSLTGTIPTNLFANMSTATVIKFDVSFNQISGPLPAILFPSGVASGSSSGSIMLLLQNNAITGTLPAEFVTYGMGNSNVSLLYFRLCLQNNQLSGSIPNQFFYSYRTTQPSVPLDIPFKRKAVAEKNISITDSEAQSPTALASSSDSIVSFIPVNVDISLASNKLTGTLPENLMPTFSLSPLRALTLDLGNNGLTGTIPESLFPPYTPGSVTTVTFKASGNKFFGSPPSLCRSSLITYKALLNSNLLNGTIPSVWGGCPLAAVDVSANSLLNGSIPPKLLNESILQSFNASGTSLSGAFPILGTLLQTLDLSGTEIDFCSAQSTPLETTRTFSQCNLYSTTACDCPSSYSSCQTSCPPPPVVTPSTCPGTAPSDAFYCEGGVWKAKNVNSTTLVLPPGVGTVIISGNITSSTIEISGIGSSIEVSGCAPNLTLVHIIIDKPQVDDIPKTKLYPIITTALGSNCSTSLDDITLTASIRGGGCRKVTVKKVTSDGGSTLSGLFTIDKSSCNTWWIVLVSVICGVLLIAVIVVVLMAIFWPAFRTKIRPFSQARKGQQNVA